MDAVTRQLEAHDVGAVARDVSLADYTSYKVGGAAALLVQPKDAAAVAATVSILGDAAIPSVVIGWGSNLIVADDGFDGAVIRLAESLRYVRIPETRNGDSVEVTVGAATMNNHLVRTLHGAGLSGAEFLALVPGTFGGAVAMNAGTRQGELVDILVGVTIVERAGTTCALSAGDLRMAYRRADIPAGAIVVEGVIAANVGGVEAGRAQVRAEREYRNRTQPYNSPNAGSVFRNPDGDYAGRLIEAAGLKGTRIGGAQISTLHANFVVTEPGARAADIVSLMARARAEVSRQFGVSLIPEQRLIGFGELTGEALLDTWNVEEATQ